MKRSLSLFVVAIMLCLLCACGTNNNEVPHTEISKKEEIEDFEHELVADESLFEWEGNLITDINSKGAKKESILIPARCEGFSGVIFQGTEIKHIEFEDDDDIELDFAFMGAEKIISVELPNNLTTIPSMAFKRCKSLKAISLPAEVTTLEGYSFSGCDALEELTFEGTKITVIGENCFENCEALKRVTIPEGVTTIEKYAFAGCASLSNVDFSSTTKSIAKFAFSNTGINEIHFPADIEFEIMDTSAFGATGYTTVVYIVKDSWCDQNQDKWDIGFSEIKYE